MKREGEGWVIVPAQWWEFIVTDFGGRNRRHRVEGLGGRAMRRFCGLLV